jgi:hypothetical protein
MDFQLDEHPFAVRAALVVACSTLALTASFMGLLAAVRGAIVDPASRLPLYVLVTAIVFVFALFTLEDPTESGVPVLTTTVGVGIAAFVIVALGGEGLVYVLARPGRALTSQLVLYFLAAALICTAVGYWGLHHWREFVD